VVALRHATNWPFPVPRKCERSTASLSLVATRLLHPSCTWSAFTPRSMARSGVERDQRRRGDKHPTPPPKTQETAINIRKSGLAPSKTQDSNLQETPHQKRAVVYREQTTAHITHDDPENRTIRPFPTLARALPSSLISGVLSQLA
jgi:hypothetical protein